ncbi:hypothetical protein DHEL01_v207679 [Diaporthe helianthi]|uniref:Uncharacterized protein n=1 Tax=Diaporthe helianthi TaxID=158607 RepID=A0A2P5HUJ1_DIAHE|nr:hypothetical protein DHEL01_v207679 [Diaporthe helianthi]
MNGQALIIKISCQRGETRRQITQRFLDERWARISERAWDIMHDRLGSLLLNLVNQTLMDNNADNDAVSPAIDNNHVCKLWAHIAGTMSLLLNDVPPELERSGDWSAHADRAWYNVLYRAEQAGRALSNRYHDSPEMMQWLAKGTNQENAGSFGEGAPELAEDLLSIIVEIDVTRPGTRRLKLRETSCRTLFAPRT